MKNVTIHEKMRAVQLAHHSDMGVPDFPRIEKALRVVDDLPPGHLLDIGYCPGSFADYLVLKEWQCIGLDLAPRPARSVRTVCADVQEGLPFASGTFDLITAGEIIEHVIDQEGFLSECHRVLRESGLLVITTPNLSYLLNRVVMLFGGVPFFVYAPYHYHFHTLKTIRRMLEVSKFSIVKVTASHVLFSRRRHPIGRVFEACADIAPTLGAHLIVAARKKALGD